MPYTNMDISSNMVKFFVKKQYLTKELLKWVLKMDLLSEIGEEAEE